MLGQLARYYNELPFPEDPDNSTLYHYKNAYFSYGDAIVLYSFLRHHRPQKLIEVGSGFSSAAILDVNRMFLEDSVCLTFIDPFPRRLLDILSEEDRRRHTVIRQPVQDAPLDLFRNLGEGDVLFIDSSHVVKIGSDVAFIFFNVLPVLNPGVIVHFHDVLWPFEYPKE